MKIRAEAKAIYGLTGLSLSQDYNETIAMWNCDLRPPQVLYAPECEDCGTSLVDKQVYGRSAWLCRNCNVKAVCAEPIPDDRRLLLRPLRRNNEQS